MTNQLPSILIIEPNPTLKTPYQFLTIYSVTRVSSFGQLVATLANQPFDLFMLSASFSPSVQLKILETLKNQCLTYIIPLIWVVDFSQPLSSLPGTGWANQLGLLHSQTDRAQTLTLIDKLLSA